MTSPRILKNLRQRMIACGKACTSVVGYPRWIINKGLTNPGLGHTSSTQSDETSTEGNQRTEEEPEVQPKGYVTLPYVKGTTEAISRVLSRAGFKVAMKPCRTLREQLVHPKDKLNTLDKAGVVYQIQCDECEASYIGHTSKNLRDRVKQHKSATDKGKINDSAIAEHAWTSHHSIDWDNVKVLDQESGERHRQIKESLHIRTRGPQKNRDQGLDISVAYNSIIRAHSGPSEDIRVLAGASTTE